METVKVLPNGTELNVMGGAYGKDEDYDEDIEVVIKIPKYAYDDLQKNKNLPNRSGIEKAITNGIVLPKGHSKLITEPTEEEIAKTIGGKNDFADCIREAVKTVFANAPTIIQADAEVENDNKL